MTSSPELSRRALIGGLGACLALSLAPRASRADDTPKINPDRIYHNRRSGESVRFTEVCAERVAFEWHLRPGGFIPFEHWHADQDEVFEVRKGRLELLLNGSPVLAGPGDTVRVPMGADHAGNNRAEGETVVDVAWEPGLDAGLGGLVYWGLVDDGFVHEDGRPHLLKVAVLTSHLIARSCPSNVPLWAFDFSRARFAALRARPQYQELYKRYTGLTLPVG